MNTSTRFRLLILELLGSFSILVLCALVCLSFLAKARQMSNESTELTRAVYLAQSAAETWKAAGENPGAGALAGEGYAVEIEEEDGEADVTVTWNGETVYTIEGVRRVG